MGFYHHHMESKIFIAVAHLPAVESALQVYDAQIVAQGYDSELVAQYEYQQGDELLELVASNNKYSLGFDAEGNVTNIWFDEINGSDNRGWLSAIAPFVRRGSYVQINDDDGRIYRLVFDGKAVQRILPLWEMQELANW